MSDLVYGIDVQGDVTPLMVRDAIVDCFYKAHCFDSGITVDSEQVNALYCKELVQKAFTQTGGDFDHPTKDAILYVVSWLQDFSQRFRDPEIIRKHAAEIMCLVEKLS